mmetsp:Transcript_1994/g.4612  ORF Transcript_1994/g.4612 Transcript_1994/m.4612 type:complete len:368 (-) Transcript_1994:1048-2151(-)
MEEVREAWSTVVPLNSGFKYVPTPDTVLHLSSCCLEVDAKCSVVLSCSTEGVKNIKLAVATSDEPQCNLRAQVYEEAILTVTSTPKQKGHVLLSGLRVPCEEKFVSAAAPAAASAADAEAVKVGKDTNVGKEAKAETTKAATKPEAAKAAVPESAPTPSAASKRAAPEEAEHRPAKAAKTASPKQSAKAPPAPAAAAAPAAKAAATATTAASTAATKTNAAASTTAAATAAAAAMTTAKMEIPAISKRRILRMMVLPPTTEKHHRPRQTMWMDHPLRLHPTTNHRLQQILHRQTNPPLMRQPQPQHQSLKDHPERMKGQAKRRNRTCDAVTPTRRTTIGSPSTFLEAITLPRPSNVPWPAESPKIPS